MGHGAYWSKWAGGAGGDKPVLRYRAGQILTTANFINKRQKAFFFFYLFLI